MKNEPKTSKYNSLHSLSDNSKVEGQQAATISFDLQEVDHAVIMQMNN